MRRHETPAPATELSPLWEKGQRGAVIRRVLESWEAILDDPSGARWLDQPLRAVGLPCEAYALQAALTRASGDVRSWEALIGSVLRSGDPWWARTLIAEAPRGTPGLQVLAIETALAVGDDAGASIGEWVRDYRDEPSVDRAAEWWLRNGRVDEVERLVDASPGLRLWKARLALWRKQPSAAREHLDALADSSEVRCLHAVCALQRGALQEAEHALRGLLDTEARSAAWGWLATVLRKQGRYADAAQAAEEGNKLGTEFNLALRLERDLSADLDEGGVWSVKQLRHAWALYPFGLRPDDPVSEVEPLLERIGGNHTPYVTTVDDGRLTAHPLPIDPGQLGPSVQRVLWTRGPEAVRAVYRELGPRVDDHPSFRVYEGEFELWMGEYDRAADIFRAVLERDRHVKWAWIGLGASASLKGNFAEAQAIWAEGVSITSAGPTLYIYRGECHRRQGDTASAREDLAQAIREKPHRVSGWMNRALLERDDASLDQAVGECRALAPFLMDEMVGDPAEKLEGFLAAMRGNRSSSIVSYHLWGRVWRAVRG